jgi:hypothetical protein
MFKLFNSDPIILDKTEVKKECDSDSGLIFYVKYDHFIDKKDKSGSILRCYYTCRVDSSENYENAKDKSISFQYDFKKYGGLINNELVSKRHYNYGDQDNVHSGLMEWIFSDGSLISERVSFTKKKKWF